MQFPLAAILSTWAILAGVCASQTVVPDHGTTTAPADGAAIAPGDSFPFSFQPAPFGTQVCFSAYDGAHIYLSTSPPTAADVPSGTSCILASGSFVVDLGSYVVPHFSEKRINYSPAYPPCTDIASQVDFPRSALASRRQRSRCRP